MGAVLSGYLLYKKNKKKCRSTADSEKEPLIFDKKIDKKKNFSESLLVHKIHAIAPEDLKYDETKDCIGRGAYASVYRSVYQHNQVAIKRLHTHHISTKALEEFQQEAGIMASVSSEFIVQLRGVCFESQTVCIVMELMPQGSLYQLLNNSPNLPLSTLLQIGLDIIHGLDNLHIRNILHRDLKSLNVLLDDRLRAKVSDFGMSKIKSEINSTLSSQAGKGTPVWAAPELFDEKPEYSKASDIYAFGLILWELVIKPYRVPFEGLEGASLLSAKLSRGKQQEKIPADCPRLLAKLMRDCWQKKPHKRPLAEAVAKSLNEIFSTEAKKNASKGASASASSSTSTSSSSSRPTKFLMGPGSGEPLVLSLNSEGGSAAALASEQDLIARFG